MKTLTGYIIAKSLNAQEDTMTLASGLVFFNRADALQKRAEGEEVFQVIIPHPQNGDGFLSARLEK